MIDTLRVLTPDTIIVDTIHSIVCNCHKDNAPFSWSISFGDILTILGLSFAIYQFIKQMKESRRVSKNVQRENWFLNVIVLPQLDSINEFYKDVIQDITEKRNNIKRLSTSHGITPATFYLELAKSQNDCKYKINDFYDHIIVLVKSYDLGLGTKISDEIMALEDTCTTLIGEYSEANSEKIRRNILANKQKIISILNTGLRE